MKDQIHFTSPELRSMPHELGKTYGEYSFNSAPLPEANRPQRKPMSAEHLGALLRLWDEAMGGDGCASDNLERSLRRILKVANDYLNVPDRFGQMSLFFRDPFKDRLNLIASTVPELNPNCSPLNGHFICQKENYDPADKVCYYELYDRLLPSERYRFDKEYSKRRGITGWIALTGCPLKLHGRPSDELIRVQFPNDHRFQCLLNEYGFPISGSRISETLAEIATSGWTQYLGAPVISATNNSVTIGVIRYTAKLEQPLVEESDLEFLKGVAHLIAVVIRNSNANRHLSRQIKFASAYSNFKQKSRYHDFLGFVADSLSSKIASVYVAFWIGNERILRLVDAYGISDPVAKLRFTSKLADYSESGTGITWNLLGGNSDKPRVLDVRDDTGWRGRNTLIFYQPAFLSRGIRLADRNDAGALEGIVKSYSIRLMGCRLKPRGSSLPVGVLKVEFPTSYDAEESYGDEDIEFFESCRDALSGEVGLLSAFLDGDWFIGDTKPDLNEFARLLTTIITLNLVHVNEKPEFWSYVSTFIKNHPDAKAQVGWSVRRMLEFDEAPVGETEKWAKRLRESLPNEIVKFIVDEGLKPTFSNFSE